MHIGHASGGSRDHQGRQHVDRVARGGELELDGDQAQLLDRFGPPGDLPS